MQCVIRDIHVDQIAEVVQVVGIDSLQIVSIEADGEDFVGQVDLGRLHEHVAVEHFGVAVPLDQLAPLVLALHAHLVFELRGGDHFDAVFDAVFGAVLVAPRLRPLFGFLHGELELHDSVLVDFVLFFVVLFLILTI